MNETETKTASDLAAAVSKAWENWIVREQEQRQQERQQPPKTIWASQFTTCARAMALHLKHGHELPPFDADTLAKFRRGDDRERDMLIDLQRIGRDCEPPFQLVGAQEYFTISDRKARIIISGKIDSRIKFLGDDYGLGFPLEFKEWNVNLTQKVERFEDLFENKWTRKGAYQLLAYLYGMSQPLGFMCLGRPGLPKLLPVELWANDNAQRVDQFLDTGEQAFDHHEVGTLPDYVEDIEECRSCRYYKTFCQPPRLSGDGAQFLLDTELAIALEERAQLEEAADTFEALDQFCKKKLRGVEFGVCNNWMIEGRWQKSTKTVFPDEATKRQYQVTDPKGKFTLKFYRIGE